MKKSKGGRPAKVSRNTLIGYAYHVMGLTQTQIARDFGIRYPSQVSQILAKRPECHARHFHAYLRRGN